MFRCIILNQQPLSISDSILLLPRWDRPVQTPVIHPIRKSSLPTSPLHGQPTSNGVYKIEMLCYLAVVQPHQFFQRNNATLSGGNALNFSLWQKIVDNISRVIVGKQQSMELVLVALFSDGHGLIENIPGLGKRLQSLPRVQPEEAMEN